jgi:Fe2+ transport system protein FeoA
MIPLHQLPLKSKAKIISVEDNFVHLQMIAKGLTKGAIIEISRKTIGGACFYIKSSNQAIAIQRDLAKVIFVEEL